MWGIYWRRNVSGYIELEKNTYLDKLDDVNDGTNNRHKHSADILYICI